MAWSPALPETLILGHTSFIGKAIRTELEHRGAPWKGRSSKALDLTDLRAAEKLSKLYGQKSVVILLSRVNRPIAPLERFRGDMAIVTNAAKALASRRAGLFVFASSTAVYGNAATNMRVTEETPAAPDSPYAISKFCGERLLRHAAAQSKTPLLILRPSMIYGPGDASTAYGPSRLVRSGLKGEVRLFGDGSELRDHLYVDDLARATVELTRRRATGLFNIGAGKPHSFYEIASIIKRLRGGALRVIREPRRVPKTNQRLIIDKLLDTQPNFKPMALAAGLEATYLAQR